MYVGNLASLSIQNHLQFKILAQSRTSPSSVPHKYGPSRVRAYFGSAFDLGKKKRIKKEFLRLVDSAINFLQSNIFIDQYSQPHAKCKN